MFTLISVTEYVVIALGAALLFGLCVFNALGALQQSGYAERHSGLHHLVRMLVALVGGEEREQ